MKQGSTSKTRAYRSEDDPANVDVRHLRVVGRGVHKPRRVTLELLRVALGLTQEDVAEAARMAQPNISRLEKQRDWRVESLRRYARALGGELELVVVLGGRRYPLTLPESADDE